MAWLRFRMNLSSSPQSSLIMGELQVFGDDSNPSKVTKILPATSGIPNYQHLRAEDLVARGPIPSCKAADISGYFVKTTPLDRMDNPGIAGNFYWIDLPDHVFVNGIKRSEFGIHFDANVPGSIGCIVFQDKADWSWFEDFMADYRSKGFARVGLIVEYNHVDPPASTSIIKVLTPQFGQTIVAGKPFSFSGEVQGSIKKVRVTADPPANHPVGEALVDRLGAWIVPTVLISTGRNRSFNIAALDSSGSIVESTQIKLSVVAAGQSPRSASFFTVEEPLSGDRRRIRTSIRFAGTASPEVKRIVATADAGGRPVTIGKVEPQNGEWSFTQTLVSPGDRVISFVAQGETGNQLQTITVQLSLLAGPIDLSKMPVSSDGEDFRSVARSHIATLVKAFQDQGIFDPHVYAFACASVGRESSWNPRAENTTDAASGTGFPGRGLAQITWEDNYRAVSRATGIDFVGNRGLMFDPYSSLRAKAAYYQLNGMIPLIEAGSYKAAACKYNTGVTGCNNHYANIVAADTPLWLPVFTNA